MTMIDWGTTPRRGFACRYCDGQLGRATVVQVLAPAMLVAFHPECAAQLGRALQADAASAPCGPVGLAELVAV